MTPTDRELVLPEGPSVPGSVPGRNWRPLVASSFYFVEQAARLLAAVRLWAQSCGRTDDDVRAVLVDEDPMTGHLVGVELAALGADEADTAAQTIGRTMMLADQERRGIAATALQVWKWACAGGGERGWPHHRLLLERRSN